MGILDRLAYRSSDSIPRNWNMTTLDTARIEARNAELRLALERHSTNSTSTQPRRLTFEESQKSSNNVGSISLTPAPPRQPSELSGPPPKKKRYADSFWRF